MLVYIPYMDPMGLGFRDWIPGSFPKNHIFISKSRKYGRADM